MTEPSTAPVADAAPAQADPAPAPQPRIPASRINGTGVLLVLGLVWMAAWLWSAHANIRGAGDPLIAVIDAALALPSVIAASMLAGAASGVTCAAWSRQRRPDARRLVTWATGALGGLLTGLIPGALVLIGYGDNSSIVILALAVMVAATVGGAIAGLVPRGIMAAGLAAALGAFFIHFVLDYFQNPLMDLFGAGNSAASHLDASNRLALTESLAAGLTGGLIAFVHLRRQASGWRFPAYLAAGATPGVLLVVAEVITRLGGAQLLDRASGISAADAAWLDSLGSSRLNHALILMFVGGIVAMIAFGRTLRPPAKGAGPVTRRSGPAP